MRTRILLVLATAVLCAACGSSSSGTGSPSARPTLVKPSSASGGGPIAANSLLMPLKKVIVPPPITAIPKTTVRIEGGVYQAFQVPGNRLRALCQQPCGLDERLVDAVYAGYQVTIEKLVRTVGFDVVDGIIGIDVYLNRSERCQRTEGEVGLSGIYPGIPNMAFICVYLTDPDLANGDPSTPMTPETAIRMGGLGVFAHEYAHVLLFERSTFSSHDFVFPIESMTLDPSSPDSADLCAAKYQSGSPLTYELCKSYGFTYAQMIASLRMLDRLYRDGLGNVRGSVGVNQYRSILNYLLATDVTPSFEKIGYMKIINEEGSSSLYDLPYASEECTYDAAVTGDPNTPIGTTLDVNQPFDKAWQIKNTGTCDWQNVKLVYAGGEDLAGRATSAVLPTDAGEESAVDLSMKAPADPGVHAGQYRLKAPSGKLFGPTLNLVIYTRPGCSVPSEFSTLAASPATIGRGALSLLSWGQVTNVDKLEISGIGEVDANGGRILVQPDKTTTYTLKATCGSESATKDVTVTLDPSLPHFAITSVTATANPDTYSGSCANGKRIDFTGEFVSNGPGVVLYQWDRNDGTAPGALVWTFDAAGSQRLTSDWTLWASNQGWMELRILAPTEGDPARANFALTCS